MTKNFDIEAPEDSTGIRVLDGKYDYHPMEKRPSSLRKLRNVIICFEILCFLMVMGIMIASGFNSMTLLLIPFMIYGIVFVPVHVAISCKTMKGFSYAAIILHFIVLLFNGVLMFIFFGIIGFARYGYKGFYITVYYLAFLYPSTAPWAWLSFISRMCVVFLLLAFGVLLKKRGYHVLRTIQDFFYYMKERVNKNNEISIKQLANDFHRPVDKIIKKLNDWNKKVFVGIVDSSISTLRLNSAPIHSVGEYCDYLRNTWSKEGGVQIITLSKIFNRKPDSIIKKLNTWIKKGYLAGSVDKSKGIYSFGTGLMHEVQEKGSVPAGPPKPAAAPAISSQTMKTRLFGMIKAMKKIDLNQATSILGINKQELQGLLFELVGEDKLIGEFKDENTFIITSGVEEFLSALDSQFDNWKDREDSKQGKI